MQYFLNNMDKEEPSHIEGQEVWQEETHLIQGKRNPSKMVGVARGQTH